MRRGITAVLAGLLLAVGAPVTWSVLDGDRADDRVSAVVGATSATTSAAPPTAAPGAGSGTRSARLGDQVLDPDPPVQVSVGGDRAEVDPVGVLPDGLVEVPEDVSRVGWYAPGPRPGSSSGSAVLVGHVDDAEQGFGVFARLLDSEPGDEVTVRTEAGTELVYDVVAREQIEKSAVPLEQLFRTDGAPQLVLITCGGDFDPAARSYGDNVVVTAVPRS